MPKQNSHCSAGPTHDDAAFRGQASHAQEGISRLLAAIDEFVAKDGGSGPFDQEMIRLESDVQQWVKKFIRPGVAGKIPIPSGALDIVASFTPDASLTEERIAALEAKRLRARELIDAEEQAEASCRAENPGQVFRDLRTRASLDAATAANALGITPTALTAIERCAAPWHQVRASSLADFAIKVRVPLEDLACCLRLAARRLFIFEVRRRTQLALGRFDSTQDVSSANTNALRLAFARLQEENRAAGKFFCEVDALLSHPSADT